MMRVLLLILMVLSPVMATAATSITQYDITWTFDGNYTTGQFANGDYWVVDPGSGVVLTSITNTFHPGTNWASVDYDGTSIDCDRSAALPKPPQGWDSLLTGYDSTSNVNHHLPYTVDAGASVLSAISWLSTDVGTSYNETYDRYRPRLKRIAILTVLDTAPSASAMRPSYAKGQKTIYDSTNINESVFPNLAVVGSQPTTVTAIQNIQGPLVDPWHESSSEYGRPSDNFNRAPSDGQTTYQAYVVPYYTTAVLLASLDEAVIGDKTPLLIRIAQVGIDYYGLLQNGVTWPANGGHQLGYKLPILIAGLMFNDTGMLNIGAQYPAESNTFQEDCNHFYVSQTDINMTNSSSWAPDDRATLLAYTTSDIGTPDWGIRHCSFPSQDNADVTATYRGINAAPDMGQGLAAMILGLRAAWAHEPFFDYLDRWDGWVGDFSTTFEEQMWDTYRADYTDAGRPVVGITSPSVASTYKTSGDTINLSGTASDAEGSVASVVWSCPTCTPSSGSASGTTSWTISNLNLSLGSNQITVTATDNEGNTGKDVITVVSGDIGTFSFEVDNYTANRDNGYAHATIVRSGGSDGEVTVEWGTWGNTALTLVDYTGGRDLPVVFADGEVSKQISIELLDNASAVDLNFDVTITTVSAGATLGIPTTATITILGDGSTCASSLAACTVDDCSSIAGGYWYNNTCNANEQPVSTTGATVSRSGTAVFSTGTAVFQ